MPYREFIKRPVQHIRFAEMPCVRFIISSFCLLLLFSLPQALLARRVSPYSGSRIFWDLNSRKTVFSSGGYARLIELQDGRLMAICESGGIQIAFSTNGGRTWTAPHRIVTNINNTPNCVPDLIQLQDGTIVVGYNPRPLEPFTEDRRFGIRCKRSTDNGKTWSDEIFVNDASYTFHDGCWEPSFLQLPSGELQLYFADEGPYTTNGDQQISLCRSFDGGQTWTKAQKISYRQGFRDGMPVPVLLPSTQEIVIAIEDNGWGYNDFLPTTVRTTLQNNWQNYWVQASDKNRDSSLDFDFCPVATGGAPYLRVLRNGETVISHQSPYGNNGKIQMRVAVGDTGARHFRAVSTPFGQGAENPEGLWNSLAVIDSGTVVAVSGISGKIEMIKGRAVSLLQAPYGRPVVDGRIAKGEGYLFGDCTQIQLGTQTGTSVIADFAYDSDSLYFIARVQDKTPVSEDSQPDAIALLLDPDDTSGTSLQTSCLRIILHPDKTYQLQRGRSAKWIDVEAETVPLHLAAVVGRTFYTVEVALPWSSLGKSSTPVGQRMAASIEMTDNRGDSVVLTEKIPDAGNTAPWTWMELRLLPLPDAILEIQDESSFYPYGLMNNRPLDNRFFDVGGRRVNASSSGIHLFQRADGSTCKVLLK